MKQECGGNEFAVADLVGDDPTDNDAETKAGKTGPIYQPNFQAGKVKDLHPIAENPTTNCETYAGGKDRHESCK